MADTRIFRIIRADGVAELGFRKHLAGKLGHNWSWKHGRIAAIEATNAGATEGWTDVTSEFLKEDE